MQQRGWNCFIFIFKHLLIPALQLWVIFCLLWFCMIVKWISFWTVGRSNVTCKDVTSGSEILWWALMKIMEISVSCTLSKDIQFIWCLNLFDLFYFIHLLVCIVMCYINKVVLLLLLLLLLLLYWFALFILLWQRQAKNRFLIIKTIRYENQSASPDTQKYLLINNLNLTRPANYQLSAL